MYVAGAVQLLQACSDTLPGSRELLLEIVCTLAQDPWPAVACPCQQWLSQHHQSGVQSVTTPAPGNSVFTSGAALALAERLLGNMRRVLQQGEDLGMLHARRLTTALQVWPQLRFHARLSNAIQQHLMDAWQYLPHLCLPATNPMVALASHGN